MISFLKSKVFITIAVLAILALTVYIVSTQSNLLQNYKTGEQIDTFDGVAVYYNGSVGNIEGRRVVEGYNVGLKYQCVEFVKRYYLEALNHKMPDSYGHAKSFFNPKVENGKKNKQRNLLQFKNGNSVKPKVKDLIVFDKTLYNPYGHVAIISRVSSNSIEIVQQNPGPYANSRAIFDLEKKSGKWFVKGKNILGWLRK